ncbi:SidA/IucD/PvdA family monooxygenase [Rahnella perminowiae]|uniref:SidA/IucD/PvdA family monooxygenase n=1 Tax=Rahnella TaxID=34037 RepID=UPI0013EE98A7|nr:MULTISPECIES: SidA/IucD/PvdA family monooxygenase [Rahnella]MCR9003621.1 lysine N(6)-hydroxylase/L-ornithine N(5)-oxygenase family protein [Rahnella perminowiae]MCX2944056.1 SidA/IucD/PvdA family monooxygenase [Rahnella perminowiae]
MSAILDILLVGAGPANLSVLSYLDEAGILTSGDNIRLVEKRENASWHPGLALPTSTLQVSLLKDLAFLRNPASPYTFFNYLKEQKLLYQFMHLNTYYPSRNLFSDYLGWVASKLQDFISYNSEVYNLKRISSPQGKDILEVTLRNSAGETEVLKTRQLVLSQGHKPFIPEVLLTENQHVIHSSQLLNKVATQELSAENHIVVVGRGQSAGEIIRFLLEKTSVGKISVVSRDFLFKSTDANPFVNDIYTHPRATEFFNYDIAERENMLSGLRNTNYATVTDDVLSAIYEQTFSDRVNHCQRLYLYPYALIECIKKQSDKISVTLQQRQSKNGAMEITADLIICATGFENILHKSLISPLQPEIINDDLVVTENFSVQFGSPSAPDIFIINHSQAQHGPTEHTLAGVSERGRVIGDALIKNMRYSGREPVSINNETLTGNMNNKDTKIVTY